MSVTLDQVKKASTRNSSIRFETIGDMLFISMNSSDSYNYREVNTKYHFESMTNNNIEFNSKRIGEHFDMIIFKNSK